MDEDEPPTRIELSSFPTKPDLLALISDYIYDVLRPSCFFCD